MDTWFLVTVGIAGVQLIVTLLVFVLPVHCCNIYSILIYMILTIFVLSAMPDRIVKPIVASEPDDLTGSPFLVLI